MLGVSEYCSLESAVLSALSTRSPEDERSAETVQ